MTGGFGAFAQGLGGLAAASGGGGGLSGGSSGGSGGGGSPGGGKTPQTPDDVLSGTLGIALSVLNTFRTHTAADRLERRGKLTAEEIMRQANQAVDGSRDISNRRRASSEVSVAASGFDPGTGAPAIRQDIKDAIMQEERVISGAERQAYQVKRAARKRAKALKRASIVNVATDIGTFGGSFFGFGKTGGALGELLGETLG